MYSPGRYVYLILAKIALISNLGIASTAIRICRLNVTYRIHLWDLAWILDCFVCIDAGRRYRLPVCEGESPPLESDLRSSLTRSDILPKSQDGNQVGCFWECYEIQGFTFDYHDSILANPLGHREWSVCRKPIFGVIFDS